MNLETLENRLRDLGNQILKLADHNQLNTEIAMVSLESIHRLLVKNEEEEENQPQFPMFQQNANIYIDPAQLNQVPMGNFHFADPQVFASPINANLVNQAASIPYLYRNPQF